MNEQAYAILGLMAKYDLVERTCQCGCGMKFKVLNNNSPNWFYSYQHASDAFAKGGLYQERAKEFFKQRRSLRQNHNQRPGMGTRDYLPDYFKNKEK